MLCPKCNHEISDNSKFCAECGTNIKKYLKELEKEKYIKCPNCAKKIEKDATFCKYCGSKTEKMLPIKKEEKRKNFIFCNILVGNIIIIILVSVTLILNGYNFENFSFKDFGFGGLNISTPIEPPQATIEVTNSHLTNLGYDLQKIEGVIENTSATVCEYPNVEIYTYDASGNRVGEHSAAPLNALNPGETYKFSIYANGASRYSVETCSCN